MSKIYKNIDEFIGSTPLLELCNYEEKRGLKAKILAKIEFLNPAGSIKDRVAKNMLDDACKKGLLKNGGTVIEPTSGNTGIGIAAISASRGYKVIIVMPENMSAERQKIMRAYGADIVLTPAEKGMQGSIDKAEELHKLTAGSIIAGQFVNPANPQAHKLSTAPEIWNDTDGKVDILVAGIGTGGTITGIGEYLKAKNPKLKAVAVEPLSSPVLSEGRAGRHDIQGIGANFVPEVLNTKIYDEIIPVSDADAYTEAKAVCREEGVSVGISSGAALHAARIIAARHENSGKNIVVIFPDGGGRYLSTKLFE